MSRDPGAPSGDLLPPIVNDLLGLAWIGLFAGRWIGGQFLLAAGVLSPSALSDLDNHVLVLCYLALLTITIAVVVLRAMRSRGQRAREDLVQTSSDGGPNDSISASAGEADGRPQAGD